MKSCPKCQWLRCCEADDTGKVWLGVCGAPAPAYSNDNLISLLDYERLVRIAERCVFYAERKDYAESRCVWRQDDDGNWFADDPCSAVWALDVGTPTDNDMHFCPVCGRPLECIPYKDEEVDDE